jgi:hypothetical protein
MLPCFPIATSCSEGLHPPHRPSGRATPSRLRPTTAHRADRARAWNERLGFAPPLQGRHGDEPLAIPEAAAAKVRPPSDAGRRPRRSKCGLSRGLPPRLALQSGVQKPLWRSADARRATAAGRGAGSRWPMRKTRTALQADERVLHESYPLNFSG